MLLKMSEEPGLGVELLVGEGKEKAHPLVAVLFEMFLVAVIVQDHLGVASGQPVCIL